MFLTGLLRRFSGEDADEQADMSRTEVHVRKFAIKPFRFEHVRPDGNKAASGRRTCDCGHADALRLSTVV